MKIWWILTKVVSQKYPVEGVKPNMEMEMTHKNDEIPPFEHVKKGLDAVPELLRVRSTM